MRRAAFLLAAAAAVVAGGGAAIAVTWHIGFGHGLYCSLGLATTDGCDAAPRGSAGQLAGAVLMLTAIPLVAAAFALATSAHIGNGVKRHVDQRLEEHHDAIGARLDAIQAAQRLPKRRAPASETEPGKGVK